jgi:hypothetical protein
MKYIKLYEGFQSEEEVSEICKKFGIKNWSINSEGLVDVDGDVDLISKGLTKIPLKFGNVSGYFLCRDNQLTSLEGSPKEVGYFNCSNNQLTSLEGCPRSVVGGFYCDNNQLTSLEGCPRSVGGNFSCSDNQLTSLEGCPRSVGLDFYCYSNRLTSLEGCPRSVGGNFWCNSNQLTSFEGPRYIEGEFYCTGNQIENVWKIISPNKKWDSSIMDLFNDYDALRGNDIVLDRFNEFLEEIGLEPVQNVKGYNNI